MPFNTPIETLVAACEREQLHLSGQIQPFGALLRVHRETGVVTHVSANLEQFLPLTVADTLSQPAPPLLAPLAKSLPPTQRHFIVREWSAEGLSRPLDVRLTGDSHHLLMEWEPTTGHGGHLRNVQEYPYPRRTLPRTEDEMTVCRQILADRIREITRFDRVMIYRFLEDWSGEVIAESTDSNRGSYLGLRFPASDIPAIARNLYRLNPYRMIPDANAAPVPILSHDGATLDLSYSDLRSVSPVHVLYLNHMAVVASFSVSILISGKLWGLVACHHTKSAFLSLQDREACARLVRQYGLDIAAFDTQRRLSLLDSLPIKIEEALRKMASSREINAGYQTLVQLLDAQGGVLGRGEEALTFIGETPPLESMTRIDHWFLNNEEAIFATDHLPGWVREMGDVAANLCGLLAVKVRSPRSGWIRFFWFRHELPYQIAWAGNPDKPMMEDMTTQSLSPRRSFAKWVEEKTGYSQPWTQEEMSIAKMLRISLLRWL
jgi:light-regulated signal transduction histidine kinase (bacteriophytochrome)